jgi:hypothetical protein
VLRRAAYVIATVVWLVLMTLPILAFILAARGEIMLGDDPGSNVRLFMVNEDELHGIGLQRTSEINFGEDCYRTSVDYLLWEGDASEQDIDFCTCYDLDTGYASPQSCD